MNRNELFKKAITTNEWSELFMVRKKMDGMFYVAMKNGPYQVEGTPDFKEWMDAKLFIKENWKRLYDEEFERMVLIGPEECEVDNDAEDSSTT